MVSFLLFILSHRDGLTWLLTPKLKQHLIINNNLLSAKLYSSCFSTKHFIIYLHLLCYQNHADKKKMLSKSFSKKSNKLSKSLYILNFPYSLLYTFFEELPCQ